MFEIFGPIFEQNASINFEPIFEKSVNFGPIFEKSVNFEHFVNGRWTHYLLAKIELGQVWIRFKYQAN